MKEKIEKEGEERQNETASWLEICMNWYGKIGTEHESIGRMENGIEL